MIDLRSSPFLSERPKADLLILPCFATKKGASPVAKLPDIEKALPPLLEMGDFTGKRGATQLLYIEGAAEKRLLLLGLGEEESCSLESLRKGVSSAIKRCRGKQWASVHFILPTSSSLAPHLILRACAEATLLTSYLFDEWKSEEHQEPFSLKTVTFFGVEDKKVLKKVSGISTGVRLARTLMNRNALDVTPQTLAEEGRALATAFSTVTTTIFDKKRLEEEKMNLLLAVGSGSAVDPALVIMEYKGDPSSKERTMVVGKGVTFDTGGLNLKPTNFIEDMRADMGGAAAVLGLIQAAATIHLKANIVALIPTTENAIGSRSYKPGDVYRSYLGTTVEITNTDAEGRLILADALAYGEKHFQPSRIIDLATLTGAIVVALGDLRTGLFSNNDVLAKQIESAGELSGERVWRFPLDPEYKELLKSEIADIKNAGGKRMAGSITAAVFLQQFIQPKTPWVHLDIAGTAFLDNTRDYHLSQATGVGVRLLIDLLESLGKYS